MVIGLLQASLSIPEARSLKDKRSVLRSLKDRIHNRFNVSVAEIDGQDLWRRSALGVAVAGTDGRHLQSVLSSVVKFIEGSPGASIIDYRTEVL